MKAENVQEWSIVRLDDGRIGVLSHHAPSGKCIVLTGKDYGVEIAKETEVKVILPTPIGMEALLAFYKEVVK